MTLRAFPEWTCIKHENENDDDDDDDMLVVQSTTYFDWYVYFLVDCIYDLWAVRCIGEAIERGKERRKERRAREKEMFLTNQFLLNLLDGWKTVMVSCSDRLWIALIIWSFVSMGYFSITHANTAERRVFVPTNKWILPYRASDRVFPLVINRASQEPASSTLLRRSVHLWKPPPLHTMAISHRILLIINR